METLTLVFEGILESLSWYNLVLVIIGTVVGLFVGAMPDSVR